MGGDDPHPFDLPPGNLGSGLDDLVRQLGGNVAYPFLSQIHGLGADVLVSRLESVPRYHVDPDAKEFLEILEQTDVIKKGGARLKVHEQVKIAARASLSPGD